MKKKHLKQKIKELENIIKEKDKLISNIVKAAVRTLQAKIK